MQRALRRIRGAIGMGVTWAIGWAIGGVGIGVASLLLPFLPWHLWFDVFDAPLPAMAVPGFFGGVIFSIVLGFAARRRRFEELSLPKFAAWGALGGLLLTALPVAMVGVGLASTHLSPGAALRGLAVVGGPFMLFGAASAAVTLLVARRAERNASGERDADERDAALVDGESLGMLPGGEAPLRADDFGHRGVREATGRGVHRSSRDAGPPA